MVKWVAAIVLVAACAGHAAACPTAAVHPETQTLRQMGAGGDPAQKAYDATLSLPKVACTAGGGATKVSLTFKVDATLGPNVEARPVRAPYFVAVLAAGEIVAKEVFPVTLSFGAARTTLSFEETVDKITLPARGNGQARYEILVGFQLTPEQLRAVRP
jgi:hypothetical protein